MVIDTVQQEVSNKPSADRWKVLAGLRFFLAWVVFCVHIDMFGFVDPNSVLSKILLKSKEFGGVAAVIGFLLISGYSIAHSAMQNPQGFYKRRFIRIYPIYAASMIFSLVPFLLLGSYIKHPIFLSELPDIVTTIGIFALLQGFLVESTTANGVIWTLSLEIFFYLLAPFLVKTKTSIIVALIAISSIAFAAYPYLRLEFYFFMKYGLATIFLGWAWLAGFLYYRIEQSSFTQPLLIILGSTLLSLNPTYGNRLSILTYVLSSLVLIHSGNIQLPKKILNIFNYLGNLSYPLYLLHMPCLIIGYHIFNFRNPFLLIFTTLITSALFLHLIDYPVRLQSRKSTKHSC